jgi:dihydrofolate reductase
MLIALVAAMDRNRLIGDGARLPWRLPADMRRFRAITMGKPIIMGRRTHESIGAVLPGRRNIVLSRDADYRAPGCDVFPDLDTALAACDDGDEPMIIGGAQIYALALPLADRMCLTLLDGSFDGDTWFPEYDEDEWCEVSREDHAAGEDVPCAYSFIELERK